MGRSVRRMAPGEAPIDLVKKVMWSAKVGEPMMEDEEKPAVGAGEKVCRRITGKTMPQVPARAVEPELALAERVEPGGRTFQSEALLPQQGAERVIGERGGQAPRRYAAAEEKLRGGFATERSRELKRFIDETGATPGCAGCKYCRWTPDKPERWQSQVHSASCRKRRTEWKEATAAGAVREPLKKEVKKIEDKKEIDVDHEEEFSEGAVDIGEPATAMSEDHELQRGIRRAREQDEEEEASEELEGRLRSTMVGAVETMGPPWHDSRTGVELDPKLVKEGMDRERESLRNFGVMEQVEDDEPGRCDRPPLATGWVLADRGEKGTARLVA